MNLIIVESPTKVPILSKFYYCYILKSLKNGQYYVGSSNNYKTRVFQHNNGLSRSTKNGRPWKLIYIEKYSTLANARNREKQIKRWKSRTAIERLVSKI
jgi:putative endonuclease